MVAISRLLDNEIKNQLIQFLRQYSDSFAWLAKDLCIVDRNSSNFPLVKQKLHKISEERKQAAKEEGQRLLDARVIR